MIPTINNILRFTTVAAQAGVNLLRGAVGLLAAPPDATPEEDALNSAIRGGELNHRTNQFDDGADPAGWYGRD